MRRSSKVTLAISILLPSTSLGDTFTVAPDGSGDFPTIESAVEACADGDVIELTDGTFRGPGNRDIDYLGKAITIQSRSGNPEVCVIDCEGSEIDPHRGFIFVSGEGAGATLGSVTVQNGWPPGYESGGAILCDDGSTPRIESCVFTGNGGGAAYFGRDCAVDLENCSFSRNAGYWGAGVRAYGAVLAITGCNFVENASDRGAAAIHAFGCNGEIAACTFVRNGPADVGAVNIEEGGPAVVRDCLFEENVGTHDAALRFFLSPQNLVQRCTFVGNRGPVAALSSGKISRTTIESCTFYGNVGPRAILCGNIEVTLDHTIVAGTVGGVGVVCPYDDVVLSCCDLYGNEGGDWVGRIADQLGVRGNIQEDPLFCDPAAGEFTLDVASPCTPFSEPNPECDLIGAWPVGCGAVPVQPSTWGSIKSQARP